MKDYGISIINCSDIYDWFAEYTSRDTLNGYIQRKYTLHMMNDDVFDKIAYRFAEKQFEWIYDE